MELARTMNSKNPMGLRLTKEAINVNLDAGGLEQALQMEDRNQILLVARALLDKGREKGEVFLEEEYRRQNTEDSSYISVPCEELDPGVIHP